MNKFLLFLIFTSLIYSQQQTDIPWPTLANTDWPMIKHDPQFTGRSPYKGPQTPTIIWTRDLEDGIFSGPVIGDEGYLYFGTYYDYPVIQAFSDYFYCYDSTGNYVWDYKLGRNRPPQSGILIDSSNTIYFGSLDKYLYALNPDGTLKWEFETSAPIVELAIPNIDLQGNIYITNSLGRLYSIKPDGSLNWDTTYESGFFNKSPVFSPDGNTIYIAGRDSNLFALNLDGSLKWKFSCKKIQKAAIIDNDENIYFIANAGEPFYFYSIYPDGQIRWINEELYFTSYSMPTIDHNGNIYTIATDKDCCPYYKALVSLTNTGDFRWKYLLNDEESDDFWQPLICDSEGTVYFGSTFGYNYYAISSDGTLKWKLPLEFNSQQVDNTSAISRDGTLYIGVHNLSLVTNQKKTLIAIKDTSTVSVDEIKTISNDYSLSQNYPNPFNPATTIMFSLPVSAQVTLKVYDVLGREAASLVDSYKEAGSHSLKFDASNLTSGIYFYQLKAGEYIETKKLILQK
ncbi:MAG: PQQ-binding-like beta-propeller repeat protein [Ignavibacteriaceae bacterium]|jgi:outer membrane protein assembly factor BamB|nr:PQQ-binding-like beta-propeller repeat protein [Ignavibacteriaceae bacterium]